MVICDKSLVRGIKAEKVLIANRGFERSVTLDRESPRKPEPRYKLGDNHGQCAEAVQIEWKGPEDWDFHSDSGRESKEPLRLSRRERNRTILGVGGRA